MDEDVDRLMESVFGMAEEDEDVDSDSDDSLAEMNPDDFNSDEMSLHDHEMSSDESQDESFSD